MTFMRMAAIGLLSMAGGELQAATINLNLSGPGVKGAITLDYGPATDARYSDALKVTTISGLFSDSNNGLGLVDAPILGLVPVNHATPEATNLLAPDEFSHIAVAAGLPPEGNGFIAYDNLFWPAGSPQTATDYPFHGGSLDIYGLLFDIGQGRYVNLWSNGIFGGGAPNYGVAVVTSDMALDYVGAASLSAVPLPGSLGLLGGGLFGLMAWRRRKMSV